MGIPILLQHGGADDNVPVFHSRRMNQLMRQSYGTQNFKYVELAGEGHWFDGVMTTPALRDFYADILGTKKSRRLLPQDFSITIANPASTGSRGGLVVDQLMTPDQPGKIAVEISPSLQSWSLSTRNIRRFHFIPSRSATSPSELNVDGDLLTLPGPDRLNACWLVRSPNGYWQVTACYFPVWCLRRLTFQDLS